jgi:NAD(P)-dependent dehydrogenase (short-subunit alcohol dehydrogenase family)
MSAARRVLVSGASSGIGAATAARFAREGWSVCLLARRAEQLEEVRRGLHPGDHWTFAADYSDLPSIEALLAELGRGGRRSTRSSTALACSPARPRSIRTWRSGASRSIP